MVAFAPLASGNPEQVGRYRLAGRLGQGGMGRVYLARSPSGRMVAVKVVRAALADDPGFRRRFVREVAAARRVSGFFTAAVVDAAPEGRPAWLATEYVPGLSLADALAEHGAWPEQAVRQLGAALTEALGAIHRAGVVHRDLKPSNVLLAADGPRVIDFGISVAAEDTLLTDPGVVIGTPGFIAPEQLRGEKTGPAADVFALGAVLAYTATGTGPFGNGAGHAVNYRVMHEEPDLGGLPSGLAGVVARCLAKNPDNRPAVPELLNELARVPRERPDGRFTATDWLPGPVAERIARIQAAPSPNATAPLPNATTPSPDAAAPAQEEGTAPEPAPEPAPSAAPPAAEPSAEPAAAPSAPDGHKRLTRRRVLMSLAVAAALAAVTATTPLNGFGSGGEEKSHDTPKVKPSNVKQLWSRSLDGGLTLGAVADGTVYLSSDESGTLRALDARDGSRLWQRQAEGKGEDTRVTSASGRTLYYIRDQYLYAAEADSGKTRWKARSILTSPTTLDDSAYSVILSLLLAQDVGTGRILWTYDLGEGAAQGEFAVSGSRAYAHGDQELYAVDTRTGKKQWAFEADSTLMTAPTVAGSTVYCGGRNGTLYAVDTRTGKEVWRGDFGGKLWNSRIADGADTPVVADGVVYFENDGYVSAFDADTGKALWRHRPDTEDDIGTLSVTAGTVYFTDATAMVYALDARSGRPKWEENLPTSLTHWRPRIVNGTLYFEDGERLRAVSLLN
ncbi:PQQ-binding-like beta-propeller repeat protein [Streptomyces sp. NBC_01508]|uniref:outer membrane protein assembly factor BamB family protein n=1 Tax=Streptomyces sp. NBC_01508 TaxID=2903888 RepID=UPI0038655C42